MSPGVSSLEFALKVMAALYVFVRGASNFNEVPKKRGDKEKADHLQWARQKEQQSRTKFW